MPDRLYFTEDDEANRLLAEEPMALLVGFVLDQQVSVLKAFSSPLELKRRLGTLDAARIAATDPAELERIFREKPALHRFPGTMAERTQAMAAFIAGEYGGDASRIWRGARDGADLKQRLFAIPGIGDMKVRSLLAILHKRFGVDLPGLDEIVPQHPTLGDVDSVETLHRYQDAKRAYKAQLRQAK
jgi:uncharacterized HhH-GPD family protein